MMRWAHFVVFLINGLVIAVTITSQTGHSTEGPLTNKPHDVASQSELPMDNKTTDHTTIMSHDAASTTAPTFEIRTMIGELPPELIDKIQAVDVTEPKVIHENKNTDHTTTDGTLTTTLALEIQTMVDELPPKLIDKIQAVGTTLMFETISNAPAPITTPAFEIRTMFEELPPELIDAMHEVGVPQPQKAHENKNTDRTTTMSHNAAPITTPAFEIQTMIAELPPELIFEVHNHAPPLEPPVMRDPLRSFFVMTVFRGVSANLPFEEQIMEIEQKVCETVCGVNSFPSNYHPSSLKANCQPCFCDQACVTLHNCCPDVIMLNLTSHDEGQGAECVETIPTGVNMSALEKNDLLSMVTTCPVFTEKIIEGSESDRMDEEPSFISREVRSKCKYLNTSDTQQAFPISDKTTKITYRNIFCAQCNGMDITNVTNILKWTSVVNCQGGMEKLISGNPDKGELYRRLNSKEVVSSTGCKMQYNSMLKGVDKECRSRKLPIIERCNQTGKWWYYDAKIERACGLYSSMVFNKYKNLFCYLCNTDKTFEIDGLEKWIRVGGDSAHTARVSFRALMDFNDVNSEPEDEIALDKAVCGSHQIYDNITCECRDIRCSVGKQLISSNITSQCASVITSNYLGYRICLKVDVIFNQTIHKIEDVVSTINERMESCCFHRRPIEVRVSVKSWCPGSTNISLNIEIFYVNPQFYIAANDLDVTALDLISNVKERTDYWLPRGVESYKISIENTCPRYFGVTTPCIDNTRLEVVSKRKYFALFVSLDVIKKNVFYMDFKKTNACPRIDLPAKEFEQMGTSFVHRTSRLKIDQEKADYIDEMTLRVCTDHYINQIASLKMSNTCGVQRSRLDTDDFDTWTVSGIVSIVCTCLSLLCLFLIFLTYLIFGSLRDGSGKNIMTLTLTLFVAQALFEFAVEQIENDTACKMFGILIHYFWLAAVFSMNACTVERFYMLCFPLKSRPLFYSAKPFIVATVYTTVSPLLIVGINMAVMSKVTGQIGYGNSRVCYINNLYSRAFSFALPIALLLLTNIILFICTVIFLRFRSVPGQKSSSTKIGIIACVRLSFITGLMWTLAFLYEFVTSDSLGYVLTALIGLQGVLFFYSIVINKRVLSHYKILLSKMSKKRNNGKTSGSSGSYGKDKKAVYVIGEKQNPSFEPGDDLSASTTRSNVTQSTSGDSGVGL